MRKSLRRPSRHRRDVCSTARRCGSLNADLASTPASRVDSHAGEKHHCDTLAAMLKLLKRDKVLAYKQMFLMYPMHKDEEVTLINPDYVVE